MENLTATYRIVTPMFIGDGNQQATSIRPPSVKGALRFWWRALNWGRFINEYHNEATALKKLHTEEARLFGSVADNKKLESGQGVFLLRIIEQPNTKELEKNWPFSPRKGNKFPGSTFLGFGLFESGEGDDFKPHREGIKEKNEFKPQSEFKLQLDFKPSTSAEDIESIEQTVRILGLVGDLGSRARRGFGSLTLTKLQYNASKPQCFLYTQREYAHKISELLTHYQKVINYPPYTAFSQQSQFRLFSTDKDARQVHNTMGTQYKKYRSKFNSNKSQKRAFGLPLKDFDEDNRRASPLFFHVHELKNSEFIGLALFLPAHFHYQKPEYQNTQQFLKPVAQFMERNT
jgi:CRISPR-associated protein Cmr1